MQKVFVSYSHFDLSHAKRVCDELSREGFLPWMDKISLLPGQTWEVEIRKAIKETNFVLLLLSQNSLNSRGYFHKEIQFVLDVFATIPAGEIFLIPARLDNCSVPEMLQTVQWIDLFPHWEEGFKRICSSFHYQKMKEITSRPIEELAPLPNDIVISSLTENLPVDNVSINDIDNRVDELVKLLNIRATKILEELSKYYRYTEVKEYCDKFENLHNQHIDALKSHNLVLAHELLRQIHDLSYKIELEEVRFRPANESPRSLYQINHEPLQRGIMITGYITGKMDRCSDLYPESNFLDLFLDKNTPHFSFRLYQRILDLSV